MMAANRSPLAERVVPAARMGWSCRQNSRGGDWRAVFVCLVGALLAGQRLPGSRAMLRWEPAHLRNRKQGSSSVIVVRPEPALAKETHRASRKSRRERPRRRRRRARTRISGRPVRSKTRRNRIWTRWRRRGFKNLTVGRTDLDEDSGVSRRGMRKRCTNSGCNPRRTNSLACACRASRRNTFAR